MSDFIKNDIASRLSARMNQRVASTRTGRFDLKLADYGVTSPHEARIMVAFTKEMGHPKRSELDQWTTSSFNGNVSLTLESVRLYPELNVVTAFVRKNRRYRPIEDVQKYKMLSVGKAKYMDEEKSIWEVLTQGNDRFLARAEKDDLDEIMRERMSRERTASVHHRLRLTDLVTAGINSLEPGDRVRFSYEGILQQGEVSKVGKDNVTVKANGQSLTVDRLAVVDVIEKAPKAKAEQKKFLVDFFTRAYGDKAFAEQFVGKGD
jgi:hypothetical protein